MEVIFEFLFEIYLEMMMFIVPEDKANKYRWVAKLVGVIMIFVVIVLFVLGGCLVFDHGKMIGWLPMSLAALLSLAQIIAGFIVQSKNDDEK